MEFFQAILLIQCKYSHNLNNVFPSCSVRPGCSKARGIDAEARALRGLVTLREMRVIQLRADGPGIAAVRGRRADGGEVAYTAAVRRGATEQHRTINNAILCHI